MVSSTSLSTGPYMIRTAQPVTRRRLAARMTGAGGFYIDGTSEVEDMANAGD